MDSKIDFKTDCEKRYKTKTSACIPKNLDLPFFAYGFFKPHQIAHSKIQRYCHKDIKEAYVEGHIKHVNGMPVLDLNRIGNSSVLGYILKFKNRDKKRAYKAIGYSKHMNIYKWKVIRINGKPVNTLVSSTPKKLDEFYSVIQNLEYVVHKEDLRNNIYNYDWRLDPLYIETITYIHDLIKDMEYDEYRKLIKTQMLYTSLWTVLDRFLTFKYGNTKKGNVIALSKEKYFKDILDDVIGRKFNDTKVFSAEDLNSHKLDIDDPKEAALYYYTLRNNVVHSGKMFSSENAMLFEALKELLDIFERVLNEVRNE
ncbi:hypothetical protein [Methanobrevibacter sp.]|uniref:hypothetical protein n=1 Tax=Methanobrevibacter sp. TaxID=66852 RepID=UPI0026E00113|nr:hypothetical protein [Methanobrevibacter sp.]MDO5824266.1 hypothetical protein [Methanobrevibacter sp.]